MAGLVGFLQICIGGGIPHVWRHKSQDHEQSQSADWKQKQQQKWRRRQGWEYERQQQQWRRQATQQKQPPKAKITGAAAGDNLFPLLRRWTPVLYSLLPFRWPIRHLFPRESIISTSTSSSSGASTAATSIDVVPSTSWCRYIHETAGRIRMMVMIMILEPSQVSWRPPSLFNFQHL